MAHPPYVAVGLVLGGVAGLLLTYYLARNRDDPAYNLSAEWAKCRGIVIGCAVIGVLVGMTCQ